MLQKHKKTNYIEWEGLLQEQHQISASLGHSNVHSLASISKNSRIYNIP